MHLPQIGIGKSLSYSLSKRMIPSQQIDQIGGGNKKSREDAIAHLPCFFAVWVIRLFSIAEGVHGDPCGSTDQGRQEGYRSFLRLHLRRVEDFLDVPADFILFCLHAIKHALNIVEMPVNVLGVFHVPLFHLHDVRIQAFAQCHDGFVQPGNGF